MRASFYQRLRRFNAVVLAMLGVALLLGAGMILFLALSEDHHTVSFNDVAAQEEAALPTLEMEQIDGLPLRIISIFDRESLSDSGPYGGRERDRRNVLLVDDRDGSSRYVLPDNRRRIIQWEAVTFGTGSPGAAGYVALVEAADRKPDEKQRYDILVGRFGDGRQAWIARGVEAMDDPRPVAGSSVGMFVWREGKYTYLRVNLATLRTEVSRVVPINPIAGRDERPAR